MSSCKGNHLPNYRPLNSYMKAIHDKRPLLVLNPYLIFHVDKIPSISTHLGQDNTANILKEHTINTKYNLYDTK